MSREKLIQHYSRLNTPDLPERIFNAIEEYIRDNGIDEIPYLQLNGRHTGTITISDGGWFGDFDFLRRLISMCRVDRHGNVLPDINKIGHQVDAWREWLTTPNEDDEWLGVDDEHFDASDYFDDDINEARSGAYAAEIDDFLNSEHPDIAAHSQALREIDEICRDAAGWNDRDDKMQHDISDGPIFEPGFRIQRIDKPEDLLKLFGSMDGAGMYNGAEWVEQDFNIEALIERMEQRQKEHEDGPTWLEFIDDLRNGRYGELPEDYDGLSDEEEKE